VLMARIGASGIEVTPRCEAEPKSLHVNRRAVARVQE
jgi:hypothetical protein